jgi:hypothetical protein
MQDNLGLLFTVGMIAMLFLMDALARRERQHRRGEVDERESRRVREPAEGGAGPSEPVAWEAESDWSYLRRFPEASESAGAEEDAPEPDVAESPRARRLPQPDGSVVVAPPPGGDESAPLLVFTGEEIRERGRRDILAVPATVPPSVDAPMAAAAPRGERSRPERTRRVARLRATLRTDSETLRDAVLFREILGRPLGFRPGPGGWQEPV